MRDNTKSAERKSAYETPIVMKFDDIARSTGTCWNGDGDKDTCMTGNSAAQG